MQQESQESSESAAMRLQQFKKMAESARRNAELVAGAERDRYLNLAGQLERDAAALMTRLAKCGSER